MSDEKIKNINDEALKSILQQVEKEFGKGSVVRLGDHPNVDCD